MSTRESPPLALPASAKSFAELASQPLPLSGVVAFGACTSVAQSTAIDSAADCEPFEPSCPFLTAPAALCAHAALPFPLVANQSECSQSPFPATQIDRVMHEIQAMARPIMSQLTGVFTLNSNGDPLTANTNCSARDADDIDNMT